MSLYIDTIFFVNIFLIFLNTEEHDRAMRDINKALSAYAAENPYA